MVSARGQRPCCTIMCTLEITVSVDEEGQGPYQLVTNHIEAGQFSRSVIVLVT